MEDEANQRVAHSLGLSYVHSAPAETVTLSLQKEYPHKSKIKDIFYGQYRDTAIRIMTYERQVGKGYLTLNLIEITFDHPLPKMQLVNATTISLYTIHYPTLTLEGGFQHHFFLYAPTGTQIEDLQIFSPDFMQTMIDRYPDVTFECADNALYFFQDTNNGFVRRGEISKKIVTGLFERIDFFIATFSRLK